MIKKSLHIALILLLLVATTGVTFSLHYCGGKLKSIAVNSEYKSCCDMDGCCENKTVHIEFDEDFVKTLAVNIENVIELEILFPILFTFSFNQAYDNSELFVTYSESPPPLIIQTRLSLLQTYLC